jgi:integrase
MGGARAKVRVRPADVLPPRAKLLRPKGSGNVWHDERGYHARTPAPERRPLGVFESYDAAEEAIDRAVHPTVSDWLAIVLREREGMRLRNGKDDRNRLAMHVDGDPLGRMRLAAVDVGVARAWLQRVMTKRAGKPAHVRATADRPLAPRTVRNILMLVRAGFQSALQHGHIDSNPFRELRVPRASMATHVAEFDGVLDPDEQALVLLAFGDVGAAGVMLRVALGTGLRKSELRSLRWPDVFVTALEPAIVVRRGTRGGPTKSGKPRRLPLFGMALEALLAWRLRQHGNPDGFVFPARRGDGARKLPVDRFRAALARAHITRRVCWHDLRHTCGTSLLMGWWGRHWRVSEVQRLLGHSSPQTTERYLHARNELIFQAASDMRRGDQKETWPTAPFGRPMVRQSVDDG